MYKKIISVMSVALVVFLCTSPVFASSSGASSEFSWNYTIYTENNRSDIYVNMQITAFAPITIATSSSGLITEQFNALCKIQLVNDNNVPCRVIIDNANQLRFNIQVNSNANGNIPWSISDVKYLGGTLIPAHINNNLYYFGRTLNDIDGANEALVIPPNGYLVGYYQLTYTANMASLNGLLVPRFTGESVTSQNINPSVVWNVSDYYNYQSYLPDIYDELISIYLKNDQQLSVLQQMLQAYQTNVPASNNLTNESSQASSTINNQHQTESNYFSDSQSAIQDTGIQNFQFNSQELGGLNGLKDDFTAVWTACGSLSRYWIASLTIGLALAIIRHRRMFEK